MTRLCLRRSDDTSVTFLSDYLRHPILRYLEYTGCFLYLGIRIILDPHPTYFQRWGGLCLSEARLVRHKNTPKPRMRLMLPRHVRLYAKARRRSPEPCHQVDSERARTNRTTAYWLSAMLW
jgi:hypothetical protein